MAFNKNLVINEIRPHLDAVRHIEIHGFVDFDRKFNERFDGELDRQVLVLRLKSLPLKHTTLDALLNKIFALTYDKTLEDLAAELAGKDGESFQAWAAQDGMTTGYLSLMRYRYSVELLRRLRQAPETSAHVE